MHDGNIEITYNGNNDAPNHSIQRTNKTMKEDDDDGITAVLRISALELAGHFGESGIRILDGPLPSRNNQETFPSPKRLIIGWIRIRIRYVPNVDNKTHRHTDTHTHTHVMLNQQAVARLLW